MTTNISHQRGKMEPIRDRKKITEMKDWLLLNKGSKYSFLFVLGTNSGLRVSDLLRLRVIDVKDRSVLRFKVQKTNRTLEVPLGRFIQKEISNYIQFKDDNEVLFPSRVGVNRPLTRQMVSQVFREGSEILQIENLNTHTMRKTFGYWYYKQHQDIYFLMKLFGHNSQTQTLDYIGVEMEEISKTMEDFSLGDD